jgi:hypothetical protein
MKRIGNSEDYCEFLITELKRKHHYRYQLLTADLVQPSQNREFWARHKLTKVLLDNTSIFTFISAQKNRLHPASLSYLGGDIFGTRYLCTVILDTTHFLRCTEKHEVPGLGSAPIFRLLVARFLLSFYFILRLMAWLWLVFDLKILIDLTPEILCVTNTSDNAQCPK